MDNELKPLVVDASVVLKWQLRDEEHVLQAVAMKDDFLVKAKSRVIAPHLIIYEILNGIVTATRQKRIARDKATQAMTNLLSAAIDVKEISPQRTLELALQYDLAAYDAAYLALAESAGCELWTGDRTLYEAVRDRLPWVRWIGEYSSGS